MSLESAIQKALKDYNRYRSPEATAKIVEISNNQLTMDFEGSFCVGCGVTDYLEDFIYELKRYADVEMTISSYEQIEPEKIRVKYQIALKK